MIIIVDIINIHDQQQFDYHHTHSHSCLSWSPPQIQTY
jgi:hypothetical protein